MAMVQMGESIQSTRMQISSAVGPPDCGITRNMTGEIDGANVVMTITENIGDELHRNDRHRHDERDLFVDLYLHKRHQRDIQLHVDAFDYEYAVEGNDHIVNHHELYCNPQRRHRRQSDGHGAVRGNGLPERCKCDRERDGNPSVFSGYRGWSADECWRHDQRP